MAGPAWTRRWTGRLMAPASHARRAVVPARGAGARAGRVARCSCTAPTNFPAGMTVAEALARLGLGPAMDAAAAAQGLAARGFAYVPVAALSPAFRCAAGFAAAVRLASRR